MPKKEKFVQKELKFIQKEDGLVQREEFVDSRIVQKEEEFVS